MRQIDLGSVHNFLDGLIAARHADGLGAVVGLLTAGESRLASLGSASVLGLRQLVGGVIDDVPLQTNGRSRQLKTRKTFGEHDDRDHEQALQQPAGDHAAIGKDADGRFSGQGFRRAGERRAQSGLELVPSRRPFHQQARRLGPLIRRPAIVWLRIKAFGNGGNFGHCF